MSCRNNVGSVLAYFPCGRRSFDPICSGEAHGSLAGKKDERLAGEGVRIGPTGMAAHDHRDHQQGIEHG